MITLAQLMASTACNAANGTKYLEPLNEAMLRFDINTQRRVAAFLATVAVESAHLTATEEGLYYSDPARLVKIFPRAFKTVAEATPFAKNPAGLSRKLYEGYHGRGLIQLTWRKNYIACGDALQLDIANRPELLSTPKFAALSAGWFWSTNKCNEAADLGDMSKVTGIVNGPAKLHLAERKAQYELAMAAGLDTTNMA
jgi:putative chitinase